ncbi:hypothetical protein Tco_0849188 [Tanacetum coccineum]
MGPVLGDIPANRHNPSTEDLPRATYHLPSPYGARENNTTEPPPPPIRNKVLSLGLTTSHWKGSRPLKWRHVILVSQNLTRTLGRPYARGKQKRDQASSYRPKLIRFPEDEVSPPRHRKERRGKDNRRPPVFGRIGKQVSGTQTANLQNLDTHENNDWRISVRDRLGSRDVHSRLGQWRSPSESPPSSDSEDSRRKRRRRVSSSSEDTSDNEDAETGHWKSKNKYRGDEDEDMSRPWRRQKVDAFTRRISDFSEDKKRRMPANVIKTYDGTGPSFKEKPPPRTAEKATQTTGHRNSPGGQPWTSSSSRYKQLPRAEGRAADNDKYTPLTMTPKEILARRCKLPNHHQCALLRATLWGYGYCENHRLDPLWLKNSRGRKDKQRSGGKKRTHLEDSISFPTLTADNAVVEPLTIEINAQGLQIHRMYIDGGRIRQNTVRTLLPRLRPEVKSIFEPPPYTPTSNFRSPSPYNGIIGRPGISAIRAVPSTAHGMLKFPVDGGIVTIYNTAAPPKECNTVTCDVTQTQRQHATKVTNLKVAIHPDYPEQEVSIGGSLSDTGRAAVCALLQRNLDIFAWEPKHMTGVPRSITEHKLKITAWILPSMQKKTRARSRSALRPFWRRYINSWRQVSCEKSITMIGSPNPVMVKKSDGSWRMFLSKSADKSLPLFKNTQKCTEEVEEDSVGLPARGRRFHAAQADI